MATHTVTTASGEVGASATLTASTVDTVTFDADLRSLTVINTPGSPADVWVTFNGSNPTVGGKNAYLVPAGHAFDIEPKTGGVTSVKLISSGAATYRVQRGD